LSSRDNIMAGKSKDTNDAIRTGSAPCPARPRVGVSSVTGDFGKTVSLGLEMIRLVLKTRIKTIGRRRPRRKPAQAANVSTA
jgi:hypothetical protein